MTAPEPVMYIVVNADLLPKMSKGKLAAQVAHSAVKASHLGMRTNLPVWENWYGHSYTKIVLKASEFQLRELIKKYAFISIHTIDEGRTEIPKGSLTTLAFIPLDAENVPPELKALKLV